MKIGIYLNSERPDDLYIEIEPWMLARGESIYEALRMLGVHKENFVRGIIKVTDEETRIQISIPLHTFNEFLSYAWYIRQKMLHKVRKAYREVR